MKALLQKFWGRDNQLYLCKDYPTTYKVGGTGVYYLRERLQAQDELGGGEWTEQITTLEEFLDRYEEMMGHDYFQVDEDYSYRWIMEEDLAKRGKGER